MERSVWTDERLDDFAASVTRELGLLRTEMGEGFRDVRAEILALRADFSAWQRQIAQIGWGLAIALIGAIVALVVAVA